MVSASRAARNRRTVANVIALGQGGGGYLFNARAGQYPRLVTGMANVKNGVSDLVVAMKGDSTIRGTMSGFGPTMHANGVVNRLKGRYAAAGIKSNSENIFGTGGAWNLATMVSTYDNRVSFTGGWSAFGTGSGPGGYYFNCSAAGTLNFALRGLVDKIKITYRNGTGGSFSVSIDGGAALQTITASGSSGVTSVEIAVPLGAHVVNVVWISGNVTLYGIEAYDSTAKQVRLLNMGRHGSSTAEWVTASAATTGPLASMAAYGYDVPIICLGANDWGTSVGAAAFKTNMQTFIAAEIANGTEPIIMAPNFDGGSAGDVANQEAYVTALRELCVENDLAMIDMRARLVSYAVANAAGKYSDTIHDSPLGADDKAQVIYDAVTYLAAAA